jgi:hypothetical protein
MKLSFVVGLLLAFSGASQAMTLGDAVREVIQEFNILFNGMIANWNANALFDTESCQTVHDLVREFPAAWALIRDSPDYHTLLDTLNGAGVLAEWNTFIQNSLQPGFGYIVGLASHTCSGSQGGNARLVTDIRATFTARREPIRNTLDRLMAASPDFAALMGRIAASQSAFTVIRCNPEMLDVGAIYRNAGFDVDGVAIIIGGVFGWTEILPC